MISPTPGESTTYKIGLEALKRHWKETRGPGFAVMMGQKIDLPIPPEYGERLVLKLRTNDHSTSVV